MSDRMKKSTVQVNLPIDIAETVRNMAESIPDSDLAGHGRDTGKPHVTIRWGLDEENIEGIRKACKPYLPFIATLGKTKIFPPSASSEEAAVVYVNVTHPHFKAMNQAVAGEVLHTPSPFDYSAHVTVCYIKPEVADKYKDLDDLAGVWWPVTEVVFSNRDKEETAIK